MDTAFFYQIGKNLEVYVDDIIVKTTKGCINVADLEDILQSVRKYNMHLNIVKRFFKVQVGNFLGYMLMKRDIEYL